MTLSVDLSSEVPFHSDELKVSFPQEHVLLLTLNRPEALNAVSRQLHDDLTSVLRWFDNEPSLWYVPHPTSSHQSLMCIEDRDRHRAGSRLLRGS